jgi:signal transduction histidine kinase
MDRLVVERLAYNYSVVILAVFFYYAVRERFALHGRVAKGVTLGLGFGAATAISIFLSVPVWSGVLLDSKMILGALAGFYGGWIAGLVTVLIAGVARFAAGGMGAFGGALGVALCVAVGAWMRRRAFYSTGWRRVGALAILGAAASVIQVAVAFTLLLYVDLAETIQVIRTLVAPTAIVYTPATLAVGLLFGLSDDRSATRAELVEARKRLEEANASLETRIAERTAELSASNDSLQAAMAELAETHARLALSEKLASLGQLVSGLAHELNSPLGAIASSAASIGVDLRECPQRAMAAYAALDAGETRAFERILARALSDAPVYLAYAVRPDREAAREALGPDADESMLETVAEFRLFESGDDLRLLASSDRGLRAIAAIGELAAMKNSSDIISVASAKAAMTVRALGAYSGSSVSRPAAPVEPAACLDDAVSFLEDGFRHGARVSREYEAGATA